MSEREDYEQELYEALIENKSLAKKMNDAMIQFEFIKLLTIFISIMVIIILIKVIWWP